LPVTGFPLREPHPHFQGYPDLPELPAAPFCRTFFHRVFGEPFSRPLGTFCSISGGSGCKMTSKSDPKSTPKNIKKTASPRNPQNSNPTAIYHTLCMSTLPENLHFRTLKTMKNHLKNNLEKSPRQKHYKMHFETPMLKKGCQKYSKR